MTDIQGFDGHASALAGRLSRLTLGARLALLWERAWSPLALILALGALFLIVSWAGLWLELPRTGRIAGLALFSIALAVALANLWLKALPPTRADGLARLDRDSGLAHRPATTLDDQLANPGSDPATQALWNLHMRRAVRVASALKVAAPAPRLMDRDTMALRAGVLCAVVAAMFMAGNEWKPRLAAAFDWSGEVAASDNFRVDAWLDPPAYTGKPPIVIALRGLEPAAAGKAVSGKAVSGKADGGVPTPVYTAPVNSVLIVRSVGGTAAEYSVEGEMTELVPVLRKDTKAGGVGSPDAAVTEKRWGLRGPGGLTVRNNGVIVARIATQTIADQPPTIVLGEPVTPNLRGSFTFAYKLDDDYGIASAEAVFDQPRFDGRTFKGRALVAPPQLPLRLAQSPGGRGEAQTTAELSEHPWAGATVAMTLVAHDEGGNEGRSATSDMTLPQRSFVKPVARALVEQRRALLLSPDDAKVRVRPALDALLLAPDIFHTPAAEYLGLSVARDRLAAAHGDADLVSLSEYLWEMALRIEEGDIGQSERDLRAAEQALREAMQRGASPEDIKRLTENLRNALDKYMAELTEKQQREQADKVEQPGNRQPKNKANKVTPKSLQALMDKMQEAQKNGDMAEAQKALDELQNTLENLRTSKKGDPQKNKAKQEADKTLSELDQMTRDEQDLRDKTFQDGKKKEDRKQKDQQAQKKKKPEGKPQADGKPSPEPEGSNPMDDLLGDEADKSEQQASEQELRALADRQGALRQQLKDAKKKMKQLGLTPDKGLDDAEEAMNDAETQLGKGDNGQATEAQGRAIQGLRKGAQGMEQQMAEQGQGEGDGDTDEDGGPDDQAADGTPRKGNSNRRTDPLDRPTASSKEQDGNSKMNAGPAAAQRAQRVLEELRRRVGDPLRPREELDYLDRLMRRF